MGEHGLTKLCADDLFRFRFVGNPVVSEDGSKVAYTVSQPDKETNGYNASIWVLDAETGVTRRFTQTTKQDTLPKWSPDGRWLGFLSDRSGEKQVWLMPADGGEARRLSRAVGGVTSFSWAPDGKKIAVLTSWDGNPAVPAEQSTYKSDVKVYRRIKYKFDGRGFWNNKWQHIWLVDLDSKEHTQLTFGDFDDEGIAWSPDSKEIAFVSGRFEDADMTNVRDLWAVDTKSRELRLLCKGKGPMSHPLWRPDGEAIGFLGHDNSETITTNDAILMVPATGGKIRNLTRHTDLSVGTSVTGDMHFGVASNPWQWAHDAKSAYFLASERGSTHLFKTDLEGKVDKVTADKGDLYGFFVTKDETLYLSFGDHTNPGDICRKSPGSDTERLTNINREILGKVALAQVEELELKGADGWDLQGWLMKPAGFDPSKRYPLVLEVHGGPHAMYGSAFFLEFQLLCAKGFVVLFLNPRGSSGYGQAFTTACKGDWGGKDYEDLMLALDQVIEMGFVDTDNMGVTGGSYGGFMTNWIVGHTDRFKAACTQRCVSNLYSFYGTSDIGFSFGDIEFPGNPWDNRDVLLQKSPFSYVKNIVTPLLIIHSEQDHRCPIEQAEQMYVALKKMGRETEFVRFPDESHDLSRSGKPHHRVERLERIVGWFEERLQD